MLRLESATACAIAAVSIAACSGERGAPQHFEIPDGAVLVGNAPSQVSPVSLQAIQKEPETYLGKTVLIQATAEDVCQAKGCWMTLKEQGPSIWVRWSSGCGGEFAFPKDAAGKRVLVEGTLVEKELSSEDAEHIAGESKSLNASEIAGKAFEIDAVSCVILPPAA